MQYKYARKLISTGDILTCRGMWAFSRGIRWWTGDDVSHCGIAIWGRFEHENRERLFMLEAMEGYGVQLIPLGLALERYWDTGGAVFWHPLSPTFDGRKVAEFALEHWTETYASPYQFILGISPRLRWLRHLRGASTDLKGWHCAELVTRAIMHSGYVHLKEPEITTPGDVGRMMCFRQRVELRK